MLRVPLVSSIGFRRNPNPKNLPNIIIATASTSPKNFKGQGSSIFKTKIPKLMARLMPLPIASMWSMKPRNKSETSLDTRPVISKQCKELKTSVISSSGRKLEKNSASLGAARGHKSDGNPNPCKHKTNPWHHLMTTTSAPLLKMRAGSSNGGG